MVRSDLGAAGVMFTIDTESGFKDVVFITSSYGLGETVVQGAVNPDEFYVHKPMLKAGKLGDHPPQPRLQADQDGVRHAGRRRPRGKLVRTVDTAPEQRNRYSLTDAEVTELAQLRADHRAALRPPDGHRVGQGRRRRQALHPAGAPRDREEPSGRARPSSATSSRAPAPCSPRAARSARRSAPARCAWCTASPTWTRVQAGDVLVTDMTDPNWEPVMKRAARSSPTAAGAPATRRSSRASWASRRWSAAATRPRC